VLDEKVNKSNKFCVCKECELGSSFQEVKKLANTQELVCWHIKTCIYFQQEYSDFEKAKILTKPNEFDFVTNYTQESTDNFGTSSESSFSENYTTSFKLEN
ncbi:16605_t:CDS:2, partial [Dentiscutata heterogama]